MATAVKLDRDLHVSNTDRRGKIRGFLTNITKFAVDSVVNVSFKGVTVAPLLSATTPRAGDVTSPKGGKKVYKIVEEGLMNQPLLVCDEKKHKYIEAAKDMQAKMEDMQEDMINLKQQNKISVKVAEGSMPQKKIPNEGIKGSDLLKTNEKRIFIRSRL